MLLGVLAGAVVFALLWGIRKCDVTPPCPLQPGQSCLLYKIIGPCPIDWPDGLAAVAVVGTVVWVDLRRREHAPHS